MISDELYTKIASFMFSEENENKTCEEMRKLIYDKFGVTKEHIMEYLASKKHGCLHCKRYEPHPDVPFFYCHLPERTVMVKDNDIVEDNCQFFMEKEND